LHLHIQNDELILEQSYNLLYENSKVSGVVWLLRDVTDAVINRRALEESRTRYKAIFDEAAIAHCIIIIPRENSLSHEPIRIVNANDAAIELFHAEDQQHLIHAFPQLMSRQVSSLQDNIQHTLNEGRSWSEFKLKVCDFLGKDLVLWVNVSLYAGTEKNALITFLDITERDRATAELYQREQFWAKIMDEIVDMIYVLSLDDKLVPKVEYRNSSINQLFGLPEPTSTSMAYANLKFHPDDHEKILELIKKTRRLSSKDTAIETCRVKDSNDHWRIIRFTNTPFDFDEKGYVCRYISSVRDVTEEEEAQIELVENERRYRLLAENVSDVIWSIDIQLNFTFISSSIFSMLGYKPDEIYRGAASGIFTRGDLKKIVQRIKVAFKKSALSSQENGDVIFNIDMNAMDKSGHQIIIEVQANYLWDENKNLEGIFGIVRNVTEARQIERELLLAGQVFDNSTEAILVTDNKGYVINANTAFFEASQFALDELRGLRPDDIINPKYHSREFYSEVGRSILQDNYWQGEIHYLRKDGEEGVSWTGISATFNRSKKVQNLIVIASDITERKVIERRIHKLAYFDPLTGLPNRSQMHERLDQMVISARHNNNHIAVLFLDLDRFKPINDSMGHPAGDLVLKEVANRLQNCIKKQDLVSRMSGDEFTLALGNQKDADSAANTAVKVSERILHALQQPFFIEQRELFLTGSIGIAIFPNDGQTVTELLKNSDMAMYHAKDDGRNNVQFFDEHMNKKAVDLLEMENDLRYAIEREELELYYQPQYAAADCSMQGVEALLRWHHKTKGLVPPGHFIPIIEDTGLIIPIGEWVLRQACCDMAEWQKNNVAVNRIAVNVSARQFKQPGFINLIQEIIAESGIDPSQLELELTESILIDDLEHTLDALTRLRAMGVRMAIDDFGTGYSSLNYLKQFPVDTLKIDQSFIRNLPKNNDDAQITRTIISMAHNLGLGVIAEGVETKEQLEFLQQIHCEEVQGFYFSKPVPASTLIENMK
jgi:diguanylate cyclase (GGDEF)-like protein/PAS domain S-box-containing protein